MRGEIAKLYVFEIRIRRASQKSQMGIVAR